MPFKIYGSDISPKAVAIAERNILSAGVDEYINLRIKPLQLWEEAPAGGAPGVLITNPPYGERINVQDMEQLYKTLGTKFKRVFLGYHAWVISSNIDYLTAIGLTPSVKEAMQNGGLDCELREYVIFEGTKSDFRREGGVLKEETPDRKERRQPARKSDSECAATPAKRAWAAKMPEPHAANPTSLKTDTARRKAAMPAARNADASSRKRRPHRVKPNSSSRATAIPTRSNRSANRPSGRQYPRLTARS